jgi:hypothetical protein
MWISACAKKYIKLLWNMSGYRRAPLSEDILTSRKQAFQQNILLDGVYKGPCFSLPFACATVHPVATVTNCFGLSARGRDTETENMKENISSSEFNRGFNVPLELGGIRYVTS